MVSLQLPPKTKLLYMTFSAEINANTTEALIAALAQAANQQVQQVYLAFSTPGGQVIHGMHLYNVLKGMPFDLTIHNVGSVNSMGNAVFMAGDQRYATTDATFMYHGVGVNLPADTRLEEQFLRDRLDSILADQKRMGSVIARHSNLSDGEVAELFLRQQTKDVTWAVDKGVINEIRDFKLTPGNPVVSLVFQR